MARLTVEIDDGLYEVAAYLAAQDGRSVESLLVAYLLRDAATRGLIESASPARWQWRDGRLERVVPAPPPAPGPPTPPGDDIGVR